MGEHAPLVFAGKAIEQDRPHASDGRPGREPDSPHSFMKHAPTCTHLPLIATTSDTRRRATASHLAERLEAEGAPGGEVGQAVGLEVDLHLRPRLQLLAQPLVRLARVQLSSAGVHTIYAEQSWRDEQCLGHISRNSWGVLAGVEAETIVTRESSQLTASANITPSCTGV